MPFLLRYRKNKHPEGSNVWVRTLPLLVLARSAHMFRNIGRWIIPVILVWLPGTTSGETAYVIDQLLLGVYENQKQTGTILEVLPTGAALEVLSRDKHFARVRTANGNVGWVDGNYLMAEKPAQLLLLELEAIHQQTNIQLEEVQAKLRKLTGKKSAKPSVDTDTLRQLQKISDENLELKKQITKLHDRNRPLVQPVVPKTQKDREWNLLTIGVILGIFLGSYLTTWWVRHSYYLIQRKTGKKIS